MLTRTPQRRGASPVCAPGAQALHDAQVEERKTVEASASLVDNMYESLAVHEQKVPTADSVKHDDLVEAVEEFTYQLEQVRPHCNTHAGLPSCLQLA